MEANQRRVIPRRKPLSDCTNTCSSSLSLKPHKTNPSSSSSSSPLTTTNLDNAPNPTSPSPSPPIPSTTSPQSHDIFYSEPVSVVYTRRPSSSKKRKALPVPLSSTPNFKISHTRDKDDEFEGANLPKAKALTVPRRKAIDSAYFLFLSYMINHVKIDILLVSDAYLLNFQKQRALSSEKDAFNDTHLQDFIEERKAYFKEIDEFELLVEVESGDELD
ncbi:hypothetical protein CR513_55634, partial [Mucuna pruriens]